MCMSLMLSGNEARSDADVCVCHVSLSRYMESGSLWHYTHAPTCSQSPLPTFFACWQKNNCQFFLFVCWKKTGSFFSNMQKKLAVETENEANLL